MNLEFASKPRPNNSQKWMLTFADLLSLILTFFVLIYSMADPIQFTNTYNEDFNSSKLFEVDNNESKIQLGIEKNVVDNSYMQNIFQNKIGNEQDLKNLKTKIDNDKFVVFASKETIDDKTLLAFYQTVKSFDNQIRIIAQDLNDSHNIAHKLQQLGMTNNLGYFEDNNLQNTIEIVIYPQF